MVQYDRKKQGGWEREKMEGRRKEGGKPVPGTGKRSIGGGGVKSMKGRKWREGGRAGRKGPVVWKGQKRK